MNKIVLLLAAIVGFQLAAFSQLVIKDPNAELREARNFHGINVGPAFDVYLNQGNEEAVAVSSSNPEMMERIKVQVKDGILHIWIDNGRRLNIGNKKLKAYISFKNIDKLNISGSCDAMIEGTLKADRLKIDLSGASDLKGKLEVNKLNLDLSGASDMNVTGFASQLTIDASGASKFRGFDFVSDFCNAEASGASDIKITVNKELSVDASGASDVDYKGQGMIRDLRTSGASSVSRG